MKTIASVFFIAFIIFTFQPIFAGPASDELGKCMVDSLTGKERKDLAKWVYFAMSAHPEIKQYSKITDANRTEFDKVVGSLITRLLTEDCPEKTKKAVREEGTSALEGAFRLVGEVAMQELMRDKNVSDSIEAYVKYTNLDKIKQIINDKQQSSK